MKYPHIAALCLATLLVGVTTAVTVRYAKRLERKNIEWFSDQPSPLKIAGSALTRASLDRGKFLPVFGSSECLYARSEYRSGAFFKSQPTGFGVFEVARAGSSAINIAQIVAGVGESLRGKKVVISYTPESYEIRSVLNRDFGRVFSDLHANELIFNTKLSFHVVRMAANRMLHFRRYLAEDPLLLFATRFITAKSRIRRLAYYAALPLGIVQTQILSIEDHVIALQKMRELKSDPPEFVPHEARTIHWDKLVARGLKMTKPLADNNPYGFDSGLWTKNMEKFFEVYPPHSFDESYLDSISHSAEWQDLRILLEVLKAYGAHAMFLGRPMKGRLYDDEGISEDARKAFYARMHSLVGSYGFQVVDFHEFESDIYFGVDNYPHTSHEAWVYVDKALDEFYHDTLPQ